MVIIIGAPKPNRRFIDDEVDDVKQADDAGGGNQDDDVDGKLFQSLEKF